LQLAPATPRLAPIYNPVTHLVPPPFPLLILVPAVAIDLLMRRIRGRDWALAAALGASFVAIMLVVHWPWASFMLSPSARTPLLNADQWDYYLRLGEWRYQFWGPERNPVEFARGMVIAIVTAMATTRLGLWIGSGMARVQR
jgi:hypothetical protein